MTTKRIVKKQLHFTSLSCLFLALCLHVLNAHAQEEILIGMSTALSGPAQELGKGVQDGVLASFQEANKAGGIKGKILKLIVLDDGYEPSRTAPNMLTLIKEKHVAAVIGNVGTPTAIVAVPIAKKEKIPFVGAFTGAGVLRKTPPDRYVINYRASYSEETAAMVDALIEKAKIKPEEIAFFTQRDGYGDAGYYGGITALKNHGLSETSIIAHGRYERNTNDVQGGFADIMQASTPPRAIIMVGAYSPCAEFIRLAKTFGYEGLFLNVSFVGSVPLAKALGPLGDGVMITQVVPHYDSKTPSADKYKKALHAHDPKLPPAFTSFEGYLSGTMFLLALRSIKEEITNESIVKAFENLGEFDLGTNTKLKLTPTEHQASHTIWPSIIRGGAILPYSWDELEKR